MGLARQFARGQLKRSLKDRDIQNALARAYNEGYKKGSHDGFNVGRVKTISELTTAAFHLTYEP